MVAISKVKQIIIDAFSLVLLIPLVIICVVLLMLFNSLVYELGIVFLIGAIAGGAIRFITKGSLFVLFWMAERTSGKYLIDDNKIDNWSEWVGIVSGSSVFAYALFQWVKRVYTQFIS